MARSGLGDRLTWRVMVAPAGWVVLLVAGVVTVAVYYALPRAGVAQAVVLCVVNASGAAGAGVTAARTRGLPRIVWLSLGIAMVLATLANIGYYGYPLRTGHGLPFPSWVDGLWLSTYPCFVAAQLALVMQWRRADHVANFLDTMVLIAGAGSLMWVFVLTPALHATGLSLAAQVVGFLYPAMDLAVLAALIRLLVGGAPNAAVRLLVGSFVALLASDIAYDLMLANGTYHFGGPSDALWMLSYLLIGVAALHPSARSFPESRNHVGNRISSGRLLFLGAALLVGPILLATRQDEVLVVTSLSVAAFLLVMTRMTSLNRRLALANVELAERTAELREAQAELLDTGRQAGMAEIAVNVLHNVGNVLNSVNVSANLVCQKVRASKANGLTKAVELIREHPDDLGDFLTTDARGRQLPAYLGTLATALAAERDIIDEELRRLMTGVAHIKEIVAAQQSLARVSSVMEPVLVSALVDDALRMSGVFSSDGQVSVTREFPDDPVLLLDRHRVMLILLNLIGNAVHAMKNNDDRARRLDLNSEVTAGRAVRIRVADNGVGIPPENLTRIFEHGFTTHAAGHGFGLHSSALAAKEMGGELTVESTVGAGTVFTLLIPLNAEAPLEREPVTA